MTAPAPRFIRIYGPADLDAALQAAAAGGASLRVVSPEGAGCYAGAGWWLALTATAGARDPGLALVAVLDCRDSPGHAMAALRAGVADLRFAGEALVAAKLADLAAASGATLWSELGAVLDLRDRTDKLAACRRWLVDTDR